MEDILTQADKDTLISLVHDKMDEAGQKNDDETLKSLAHIARKLGDGA
jgi:hypothetical protein